MQVSIVIPIFNERDNVVPLAEELVNRLHKAHFSHEVIFVNDNSNDGSTQVLEAIRDSSVHVLTRRHARGLSSAVVEGASWARFPYIAVMDGDGQHRVEDLISMLDKALTYESDLLIGSRYLHTENISNHSGFREYLSLSANKFARYLIKRDLSDPMSGFFIIRRAIFEPYAQSLYKSGFKILFDLLFLIRNRREIRILEYQIDFDTRKHGVSKLNLAVAFDFVADLINKFFGNHFDHKFVKFCFVGFSGMILHLTLLWLCLALQMGFVVAQSMAVIMSMLSNFTLNNAFTFNSNRLLGFAFFRGFARYLGINFISIAANVGVASTLYTTAGASIAAVAGIGVGTLFNYIAGRRFVWHDS